MAGFPAPFPLAPLDATWGSSTTFGPNPFDTQPSLLQFNNSLKDTNGDTNDTNNHNIDDDDNIDVDGLHDAANFILGNTLHYTPHNFHSPIVIPYPTSIGGCCYDDTTTTTTHNATTSNNKRNNTNTMNIVLPVCAKCKRHYKTRDVCRIKFGHTDVPWTNTFICITLDESCFTKEDNNGTTYITGNDTKLQADVLPSPQSPAAAGSQQQQQLGNNEKATPKYIVNTCLDNTAPVCMACKQNNRTKAYCRKKMRHKELPWNTLFALLKLQRQHVVDTSGGGATSSGVSNDRDGDGAIAEFLDTFQDCDGGESQDEEEAINNNTKMPPLPTMDQLLATEKGEAEVAANKTFDLVTVQKEEAEANANNQTLEAEFDINCIAPSRTFLSIISSTENSIRWLTRVASEEEEEEDDDSEMSKKSSSHQQQQSQEIDFMSNLDDSITTKKKTRKNNTKKKSSKKSKHTMKKPKSNKRYKIDNTATLALEAIEYAKQQAKKEQDAAVLMTQRFTRFVHHPQLLQQQQQQQQQLLLQQQQQQQAMYQLQQDTAEKQRKEASYENDQPSYDDEKMPVTDDLGVINNEPEDEEDKMSSMLNGDDILDEAAKLAEWL